MSRARLHHRPALAAWLSIAGLALPASLPSAETSDCRLVASRIAGFATGPRFDLRRQTESVVEGHRVWGYVQLGVAGECSPHELTKLQDPRRCWEVSLGASPRGSADMTSPLCVGFHGGQFAVTPRFGVLDRDTDLVVRATSGDVTVSRPLRVKVVRVASVSAPSQVEGGDTVTATVRLDHRLPRSHSASIALASSDPAVVGVPGRGVTVGAGSQTASFTVVTQPVSSPRNVVISATYRGVTREATITVLPPPEPKLLGVTIAGSTQATIDYPPDSGRLVSLAVTLTAPAPAGGVAVPLSWISAVDTDFTAEVYYEESGDYVYFVSRSVVVPAGQSSATTTLRVFPCRHYVTGCRCDGRVTASYDGITQTASILVKGCENTNPAKAAVAFLRADSNADGNVDLSDALGILAFLFLGDEAPPCAKAADVNDDGEVNVTDPLSLLEFLFQSEAAPPAPFSECGTDETDDTLACESFPACGEGR